MEPVSAIGLAGNILQFVEFGIRVVSKGYKIYRSVDGCLVENLDLEIVTSDLVLLQKKIQTSKPHIIVNEVEDDDQNLRALTQRCSDLADELLEKLNKAKAQGRFRKWKSLRQAIKSVWSKKDVDEMANRLQSFKSEIQLHLMISMKFVVVTDSINVSIYSS